VAAEHQARWDTEACMDAEAVPDHLAARTVTNAVKLESFES
jgi:hypothetical protein